MARKKSAVQQLIQEAITKVDEAQFPEDPEISPDVLLSGPERFARGQKSKDEVVIDGQLADIATKEGYFLKLKKEMRPNEWMLMKAIESDWRRWPDLETAVADIVKEHTRTAPQKWGSGAYRVEYACRGGMRGKTYPPIDFYINAEEEFLSTHGQSGQAVAQADPTTQVTAQLDMLRGLMDVVRGTQPTPLDPGLIQKQHAEAFQQGLAIKANEGNAQVQMMTAMMTGLMTMMTTLAQNRNTDAPRVVNPQEDMKGMLETLRTFGVIGGTQEKPKSLLETLAELKAIGIDPLKKDDPMEQIGKLKQIASVVTDLVGGSNGAVERPSILEKLIDVVGPSIPMIMKNIKETADQAVRVQVEAGKNMERARALPVAQPQAQIQTQPQPQQVSSTSGGQMSISAAQQPAEQTAQAQVFFNSLYDAVVSKNQMFYPIVYTSLLQDAQGIELINGVIAGTYGPKELIELLKGYGDKRFTNESFVTGALVPYVNGFVMWLRGMVKQEPEVRVQTEGTATNSKGVDVICDICGTEYLFDSEEAFNVEESKVCDRQGCKGTLQLAQPQTA